MSETLQHSFNLDLAQVVGVPQVQNISNQFDQAGFLLNIPRLSGEKNIAYKQRILDVYVHRAGAHYQGLVFGITRELGLTISEPLRIFPRKDANGNFFAKDPVIVFSGPQVTLYSDWGNGIIELQFDRYEQSGVGYQILTLANYISDNSTSFEVNILSTDEQYYRSMTILDQSNLKRRIKEVLPQGNAFFLENPGRDGGLIRLDSLKWTDKQAFLSRVETREEVLSPGEYYVDKLTGLVVSFSAPTIGSTVEYEYIRSDWRPLVSEVIVHRLDNPEFEKKMFEQCVDNNGLVVNGLPTQFGAEIINELMSVYPLYFGK